MSTPLRVLFISHDASRTGAPRALIDIIRWLVPNGVTGAVMLRADGPLREGFAGLLPTVVADPPREASGGRWRARFRGSERTSRGELAGHLIRDHGPFDLVYANTCTNGELLRDLQPLGAPVITHAHEMGFWMDHVLGREAFDLGAAATTRWIAASTAVEAALVARGVHQACVAVVPPPSSIRPPSGSVPDLRHELGAPPGARVVLSAGTLDWRKGPDLFVQVAREVLARRGHDDAYFAWVGGGSPHAVAQLRHDADGCDLGRRFVLLGERDDAAPYLAQADVVAVTSREDPYPLVMLEGGVAGAPIVTFSGSGGADEFARSGGGLSVPHLDVRAMGDAVAELLRNEVRRAELGQGARQLVLSRSDPAIVGAAVLDIIRSVASSAAG